MGCEGKVQNIIMSLSIKFIGVPANVSEVQDSRNSSDPLRGKPKSLQKKGSSNIVLIADHLYIKFDTFVVETKKTDLLPKKCSAKGWGQL